MLQSTENGRVRWAMKSEVNDATIKQNREQKRSNEITGIHNKRTNDSYVVVANIMFAMRWF
jgi:hypothetical protein